MVTILVSVPLKLLVIVWETLCVGYNTRWALCSLLRCSVYGQANNTVETRYNKISSQWKEVHFSRFLLLKVIKKTCLKLRKFIMLFTLCKLFSMRPHVMHEARTNSLFFYICSKPSLLRRRDNVKYHLIWVSFWSHIKLCRHGALKLVHIIISYDSGREFFQHVAHLGTANSRTLASNMLAIMHMQFMQQKFRSEGGRERL